MPEYEWQLFIIRQLFILQQLKYVGEKLWLIDPHKMIGWRVYLN